MNRFILFFIVFFIAGNSFAEFSKPAEILLKKNNMTLFTDMLKKKKIDINAKEDKTGNTLLIYAVKYGRADAVKLLLRNSASLNKTNNNNESAFLIAANNNDTNIMQQLLDFGADKNIQDISGNSAVMIAIQKNYMESLDLLISKKADINAPNNMYWTPLMEAAKLGNTEALVTLLEQKNIDINATDKEGFSALFWAIRYRHSDIVTLLIKEKININSQNIYGLTPISQATSLRFLEIVKLLLKAGADPNIPDKSGMTPLHYATLKQSTQMVALLLNSAADPLIKNKEDKTPYDIAKDLNNNSLIDLYKDYY